MLIANFGYFVAILVVFHDQMCTELLLFDAIGASKITRRGRCGTRIEPLTGHFCERSHLNWLFYGNSGKFS